jgi:hypothetical protein
MALDQVLIQEKGPGSGTYPREGPWIRNFSKRRALDQVLIQEKGPGSSIYSREGPWIRYLSKRRALHCSSNGEISWEKVLYQDPREEPRISKLVLCSYHESVIHVNFGSISHEKENLEISVNIKGRAEAAGHPY